MGYIRTAIKASLVQIRPARKLLYLIMTLQYKYAHMDSLACMKSDARIDLLLRLRNGLCERVDDLTWLCTPFGSPKAVPHSEFETVTFTCPRTTAPVLAVYTSELPSYARALKKWQPHLNLNTLVSRALNSRLLKGY